MRRIRETGEVRAVLRRWADDASHPQTLRAHDAYVSTHTCCRGPGLCLYLHPELLAELRRHVEIEEISI